MKSIRQDDAIDSKTISNSIDYRKTMELSGYWLLITNAVGWMIMQVGIGYFVTKIPDSFLDHKLWLFKTRSWERAGSIYDRCFFVRRWKSLLPSGATILGGFSIKRVSSRNEEYLKQWGRESCRAELTHWFCIIPVLLFFVWNPLIGDIINLAYALVANLPCIIAQRYNRPRILIFLAKHFG
ncbi:MAG: glycosyl-4,4'-diaponeurosporenoate acyltransferase [Chloroflexota bacterium]|nr:glycosyl-4,4'-diaponeurosporenoate acyltransferase [Chloroflexota bacterium]